MKLIVTEIDKKSANIPPAKTQYQALEKISKVIWSVFGIKYKGETNKTQLSVSHLHSKYDPAGNMEFEFFEEALGKLTQIEPELYDNIITPTPKQ